MSLLCFTLLALSYASTFEQLRQPYVDKLTEVCSLYDTLRYRTPRRNLSDTEIEDLAQELTSNDSLSASSLDILEHTHMDSLQKVVTRSKGLVGARMRTEGARIRAENATRIAEIQRMIQEAQLKLEIERAATTVTQERALRMINSFERIDAYMEFYISTLPAMNNEARALSEEQMDVLVHWLSPVSGLDRNLDTLIAGVNAMIGSPHVCRSSVEELATLFRSMYAPVVAHVFGEAREADRSLRRLEHRTKDRILLLQLEYEELEKFVTWAMKSF